MKNPLVSIIIPVYNGADYVAEAIESALSQDYPNFEVVVVNDGSKDDGATDKVCKSFSSKIRYFKKANGGVASALNEGVKEMKGEYFSWLSHDDLYFPDKLSKEIAVIQKSPEQTIIYSNYEEVDQNGAHLNFVKKVEIKPAKFLAALVKDRFLHGCTLLIPKQAFTDDLFDLALRNTQDYDLWFRLLKKGWQFRICPDFLVKSRKHNKQTSISTSDRQKIEDDALYQKILSTFSAKDLVLKENIALEFVDFAVNWQLFGSPKAAKKAYQISRQHLTDRDFPAWFWKSVTYFLLIIFSRPILKFMDWGARIKRSLKHSKILKEVDSNQVKVCFIGNIDSSHNAKYAQFCAKEGFEVHFISFFPGEVPGVKTYHSLRRPYELKFIWLVRTFLFARKMVKKINPTFVQGQYLSSGGVLAYLSGFRPYIVNVLGSDVLEPLPGWLAVLSRRAVKKAAWIFASSETLMKAVVPFGARADQVSIFRFGIDLELFKPFRTSKIKGKIILSPRFIDRIYNIDVIVKAFGLLNQKDVKLALVDKPVSQSYYQEIKELIDRLNLKDRVIWLPVVKNEKMPEYYNQSEVVVSIPDSEGAGVSVFEAMACQKKVITLDLPVFKEWSIDFARDKKNLFITKNNPLALKKALEKALEMPAKDFLKVGRMNRQLVRQKADLEETFKDLKDIYSRIIGTK